MRVLRFPAAVTLPGGFCDNTTLPTDLEGTQYEITDGFTFIVYDRLLVAAVIWSPLDGRLQIIAKSDVVQFRRVFSTHLFRSYKLHITHSSGDLEYS